MQQIPKPRPRGTGRSQDGKTPPPLRGHALQQPRRWRKPGGGLRRPGQPWRTDGLTTESSGGGDQAGRRRRAARGAADGPRAEASGRLVTEEGAGDQPQVSVPGKGCSAVRQAGDAPPALPPWGATGPHPGTDLSTGPLALPLDPPQSRAVTTLCSGKAEEQRTHLTVGTREKWRRVDG